MTQAWDQAELSSCVKDNNGENVETYYRQVRSLVESHEDVIEKENCVIIGVKSAKKLIKPGTNQVDFSLKIRSLKEEAKDDSDESGIDDWKYYGAKILGKPETRFF